MLYRLEHEDPLDGGVDANLMPDIALGVTAVSVSSDDPFIDIDEVAVMLHSACLVSELLEQSDRKLPELDPSSSNSTITKESNQ